MHDHNDREKDMTATMHAIRQDELGGTEVLKLITVPIPEPGMGEIVVTPCSRRN